MSDSLAADAVAPHIRGRFGKPYRYEPECESTQLLLLGSGLAEGAVAATDHQTSGKGRHGRAWVAPPGSSLLLSVMLHPPPERHLPELSLVAALAAAEAIEGATGLTAQIKWPNDVMLNRRKVAGILGELRDGVVVLGIGINVNQAPSELPPDARLSAGSLRSLTGTTYDRAPLLASLLRELETAYDAWSDGGLDAVFEEIGPRDFLRGRSVSVDGRSGVAVAITRDGALEIDIAHGERVSVTSGEVEFAR